MVYVVAVVPGPYPVEGRYEATSILHYQRFLVGVMLKDCLCCGCDVHEVMKCCGLVG